MRAVRIVVLPSTVDDNLRFLQRVEDLAVEKFVTEICVEASAVAVLPEASRLEIGGLCAHGGRSTLENDLAMNL